MRILACLTIVPLIAACGRLGFNDTAVTDAAGPADAPLADRLACGKPAQFTVPATTARIAATRTAKGYAMFAVDDTGALHGQAYDFSGGTLAAHGAGGSLAINATGPLGVAAVGNGVMLVVPTGRPAATGTQLLALDALLAPTGNAAPTAGWYGGPGALAVSSLGAIAALGTLDNREVDVKLVSPLGADLGAFHPAVDKADLATQPTIVSSGGGYLVAWSANAASPNEVRAEVLDAQLGIVQQPVTISQPLGDAFLPRVAYAAAQNTYLFAWTQKIGGNDVIGLSLRDGKLATLPGDAANFTPPGGSPSVVAGDADFLVVWQDDALASRLGAARITANGEITSLIIKGSGGKAVSWDLVVRNGQPALVWLEAGATVNTVNVWIDPLCG